MELQTKRYLQGAGLTGLGMGMVAMSSLNSSNSLGAVKAMATIGAGGLAATAVTATIAGDGEVSGTAKLLGLGAGVATGAAVGAATLGGPSTFSLGLGAAAGLVGGFMGALGVGLAGSE